MPGSLLREYGPERKKMWFCMGGEQNPLCVCVCVRVCVCVCTCVHTHAGEQRACQSLAGDERTEVWTATVLMELEQQWGGPAVFVGMVVWEAVLLVSDAASDSGTGDRVKWWTRPPSLAPSCFCLASASALRAAPGSPLSTTAPSQQHLLRLGQGHLADHRGLPEPRLSGMANQRGWGTGWRPQV